MSHSDNDQERDSWKSHLWFGLAAIALVVPLLIPGLVGRALLFVYLAVGGLLMVAPIAWGVIRSSREAWRLRRERPRRSPWLG